VPSNRSVEGRAARLWDLTRLVAGAFREHDLLTYSSAIAFRGLVALVPLTLLGLALLGALGLEDVWSDTLAPKIEGRVTAPVFEAIDYSVQEIFRAGSAGLIAFAALLLLWDLVLAIGAIKSALNRIHDTRERRSRLHLLVTEAALAIGVGVCLVGAALVLAVGSTLADGTLDALLGIARWIVAVILVGVAVGLLVRYAPAERPDVRWASAGSFLVVAGWIVASLAFELFVKFVADFRSATGSLAVFLVLTAYVFTSAAVFIAGAQLDELLRKDTERGKSVGVLELLRAAFGRSP
jgi:membrane protein